LNRQLVFHLWFVRLFFDLAHSSTFPALAVDVTPFLEGINCIDPHSKFTWTFQFRIRTASSEATSSLLPPSAWYAFRQFDIHHTSRTVWYRALHHRLPTRVTLHRIFPTLFPDHRCPICLQDADMTFTF